MAIGDEAGFETLRRSNEWLPGLLGAENFATLVDAIETQIKEDIAEILEDKLAKAEEAATRVVDHALTGAQRLTEEQVGVIRQEAAQLVDHGLEEFRKLVTQAGMAIDTRMNHATAQLQGAAVAIVLRTRQEAEGLIDQGITRATHEAERLVDVLSKAIAEQRVGVKVDLGEVAVDVRKELLRVLPWVALIIGGLNLIGVVVAVLLTR